MCWTFFERVICDLFTDSKLKNFISEDFLGDHFVYHSIGKCKNNPECDGRIRDNNETPKVDGIYQPRRINMCRNCAAWFQLRREKYPKIINRVQCEGVADVPTKLPPNAS